MTLKLMIRKTAAKKNRMPRISRLLGGADSGGGACRFVPEDLGADFAAVLPDVFFFFDWVFCAMVKNLSCCQKIIVRIIDSAPAIQQ